ncbi:ubiqutin C-terminal hydrolase of the cysteine fold [Cryptosporidium sp. chipmunk genotype I]|uniref:ubiqutin C-terminal hydrolase of the cysteine fold n=1 Tax=Cryptosporidium sp. chipmunk genotype I TaxID=1280935 RepID=UPI00351A2EC9|nr:ubiqutin C-terminal hydrolase of the cysteine fold [Cryptosporidium sp. chipmunk genotype I]
MVENKDEVEEGEDAFQWVVDPPEKESKDTPEIDLEAEAGKTDMNTPCLYSSSVSDSYSSVNSSPFISISTKLSGSILTGNSISPVSSKLDLERYSVDSSSESSIPTFPTFKDSSCRKSRYSGDVLKEEGDRQELMKNISQNTSESSLEELLLKSLTINGIVMKNLNDLASRYSGDLLSEFIKLDLKLIVENFFGIYSIDYYEKNIPLICSFLSVLFELSFNENKLSELNVKLWAFFEYIIEEILQIFDIKEINELPLIPVVHWMIENWNRYDMFLTFKNQENEERVIKNRLNEFFFSLHLRNDLEAHSTVLEYYFRLILDYRASDALQGCILYVIKSTKFLVNYLLAPDKVKSFQINYRGIVEIFNNFDQNRIQIFSRTLEILICNSKLDECEDQIQGPELNIPYEKAIPIYFFSAFFLIKYPEGKTTQKILIDVIISICNNNSLKFEHKKQSIVHIINLVLHACKNTLLGGFFDRSILDLLLEIFNLEIWRYLDKFKILEALDLVDGVIRDLTERVRLGDSAKNEFEAISGLYKLQSILLVASSDSFKNEEKRGGGGYNDYGVEFNENSWRSRLVNSYLSLNEKDKGIRNIGNTCYLNSTIQCLALSYYFMEWLHEYMRNKFSKPNKLTLYLFESLNCILDPIKQDKKYDIIGRICNSNDAKSVDLRFIKEISNTFSFGKQHDACEFLRYLLTNIDHSCPPFIMVTKDSLECLSCGVIDSKQNHSLSVIDLYVFNNSLSKSDKRENLSLFSDCVITLESLIESYFLTENIPDSLDCDHCKRKSASKKWTSIINPSKYVVLAIHNYYWDQKSNKAIKQNELKIKFNELFMLNNHKYIIYALIFHKGKTTSSGHYYAIGRKHFYDNSKQKNPNWFKYNDDIISSIESFHQIQKSSENPFLIFALLADN